MQIFDKSQIKANFNYAYKSYESAAILQKIVAKNLVDFASNDIANANKIIDLGCGTGFIANQILKDDKQIFQLDIAYQMLLENSLMNNKINGDIEFLPFRKNSFDLAISSLSFQWLNNFERSITLVLDIVKNGGSFDFSLIADGSLQELKQACNICDVPLSINDFITIEALNIVLNKLNLSYTIKSEEIVLEYDDFYSILKSIKLIGANYSQNRQYVGRKQFEKLANFYFQNFNLNNKVFATWKVAYTKVHL